MSKRITFIFDEQISRTDNVKFYLSNLDRDINYNINIGGQQIILKSSVRPEWDADTPHALFLQGSAREYDHEFVDVPRKNLKYLLFAVWQYNLALGIEDTIWIDKYRFKCKHCNGIKSVRYFDQDNFEYCLDCKSELRFCTECKKLGANHLFNDKYYCDNCVQRDAFCQICETEHKVTRYMRAILANDYHGTEKHIQSCSDCCTKSVEFGKENHYHFRPSEFNFLDYDFKSKKIIRYETPLKNMLFMGTEIESQFDYRKHVNIVLGKILKLNDAHDHELIYAKHDGTIPDPGSEIVTHPMTLNMFRALTWGELFDNIIKPTTKGIGGHIHINKTAFVSPLHVYKFCKFIRTNVRYIEWIAERNLQSDWCKSYSNNGKVTRIAKRFKQINNDDRYEMINFTPHTIELRFFWSPANTGMLLKNVEFVDALHNYSRETKLHFSYEEFEDYINKRAVKYPYLYNFILKRDVSTIFKTNAEECNKYAYDTSPCPEPEEESICCDWCGEYIHGEEIESSGSYYHPTCYDVMVTEDVEPDYDEDMD